LLFERGVMVSYEMTIAWCEKFGAEFSHQVKAARCKSGSTWNVDEVRHPARRTAPALACSRRAQRRPRILLQRRHGKAAAKRLFSSDYCTRTLHHTRSSPIHCAANAAFELSP
jgi:putative transposase